jgi:hypothetical protein
MKKMTKLLLLSAMFTGFPTLAMATGLTQAEKDSMLTAHNNARASISNAIPQIPSVTWSESIASTAQELANQIKFDSCRLQYKRNIPYGQTLAYTGESQATPADVVNVWMSEKEYYDPITGRCNTSISACGHFTQVVWRKTRQIGCGVATCSRSQVWVCMYNPQGNIYGEKAY